MNTVFNVQEGEGVAEGRGQRACIQRLRMQNLVGLCVCVIQEESRRKE